MLTLVCHRTLTLKKCRKILEGDMGLNAGGLDDHKDYVRDLIEKLNPCSLYSLCHSCTEHNACPVKDRTSTAVVSARTPILGRDQVRFESI